MLRLSFNLAFTYIDRSSSFESSIGVSTDCPRFRLQALAFNINHVSSVHNCLKILRIASVSVQSNFDVDRSNIFISSFGVLRIAPGSFFRLKARNKQQCVVATSTVAECQQPGVFMQSLEVSTDWLGFRSVYMTCRSVQHLRILIRTTDCPGLLFV